MQRAMCVGFVVMLLVCPAWAEIINGSFETGDFTGWGGDAHKGYSEVVPGGTDGYWTARLKLEGTYVDMPGGTIFGPSHVGVAQRFLVPDDAEYLLFDSWVEGFATLHVSLVDVHQPEIVVSGHAPATYFLDISDRQGQEAVFMTLGRDTDVSDANYAYLDNVRLVLIPEPSCVLLVACGMAGVAALRGVG